MHPDVLSTAVSEANRRLGRVAVPAEQVQNVKTFTDKFFSRICLTDTHLSRRDLVATPRPFSPFFRTNYLLHEHLFQQRANLMPYNDVL